MISADDLKEVINRLTGEQSLSEDDMDQLVTNVSTKSMRGKTHGGKEMKSSYITVRLQ